MDNNRDAVTSGAGCYAKPSAAGTVWFVFVPAGNQTEACATREAKSFGAEPSNFGRLGLRIIESHL